jgi:hypothetical protein
MGSGGYLRFNNCYFDGADNTLTNIYLVGGDEVSFDQCEFRGMPVGSYVINADGQDYYGGGAAGRGIETRFTGCRAFIGGSFLRTSNQVEMANTSIETVGGDSRTIYLTGGEYHRFTGNFIGNNGYNNVRVVGDISHCLFSGNIIKDGNISFEPGAAGSHSILYSGNICKGANSGIWAEGKCHTFDGNIIEGTLTVRSGTSPSWARNNRINNLTLSTSARWVWENNTITGTLTGSDAQKARQVWRNNTDLTGMLLSTVQNETLQRHYIGGELNLSTTARWPNATLWGTLSGYGGVPVGPVGITFTNLYLYMPLLGAGTNATLILYTNGAASSFGAIVTGTGSASSGNSGTASISLSPGDTWGWHWQGDNPTTIKLRTGGCYTTRTP